MQKDIHCPSTNFAFFSPEINYWREKEINPAMLCKKNQFNFSRNETFSSHFHRNREKIFPISSKI